MARLFFLFLLTTPALTAGTLTGTVIANGVPMNDVYIQLYEADLLCYAATGFSDEDGTFQVVVPDGTYVVKLGGDDVLERYVGNDTVLTLEDATRIEISGDTVRDFEVRRAGAIEGHVDIVGVGAEDASLWLIDPFGPLDVSWAGLNAGFLYTTLEANGNFRISNLEAGCYLLGLAYHQGDLDVRPQMTYYPGTLDVTETLMITVTEGQTVTGIDFSFDPAVLGTLQIELEPGIFEDRPSAALLDSKGQQYVASLEPDRPTDILLPPETYTLRIGFGDPYLSSFGSEQYEVRAGQVTKVTRETREGGTIKGKVDYEQGGAGGSAPSGFVDLIDLSSGGLRTSGFQTSQPPPHEFSFGGLPDGLYLVRIRHGAISHLTVGSIMQMYYPGTHLRDEATALVIANANTIDDIDFEVVEGGSIEGSLILDGRPMSSAVGIGMIAEETTTGESYVGISGFFGLPYRILGLPPGNYRVGTEYVDATSVTAPTGFNGCDNLAPSFYDNARNPDDSTEVSLAFGEKKTGLDITLFRGGGFSGSIVGGELCDCPVGSGIVIAYRDDVPIKTSPTLGGVFALYGLEAGVYTLKIHFGNPALDQPDTHTYPQSITVDEGLFTHLEPWCLDMVPVTADGGTGQADKTRLLYTWISNRTGDFESILIANNFGDTAVTATLTARRASGEPEVVERGIPAHGFLKERASSLFPGLGSGSGYTVTLEADTEDIRGRWVTNNLQSASGQSPSQGVAVVLPENGETNALIGTRLLFGFLPVTDSFNSAPVIVNIGDGPTTVTLEFYDATGAKVGQTSLENLEPNRPFATAANNLVTGDTDVFLVATSDRQLITGVSFTFNSAFETAIGNVTGFDPIGGDTGTRTLVYPWVSNRSGEFQSVVIANNLGTTEASVALSARRKGETAVVTEHIIPAGGFFQMQASELFPGLDGAGYSVELTTDSSKVFGQWVTNNLRAASGASPSQGIAIDIGGGDQGVRVGDSMLFGYLPVTETFVSAPVVVNAGTQPTDVVLFFFDEAGNEVARDETTMAGIQPKEPVAVVVNTLVPDDKDVYMVARSVDGTPITGVGFVFNAELEPAIGNATAIQFTPPTPSE